MMHGQKNIKFSRICLEGLKKTMSLMVSGLWDKIWHGECYILARDTVDSA